MSLTVCLSPRSCIGYPSGGGYLWIFLNWALGLRSIGCKVIWLEEIWPSMGSTKARDLTTALQQNLRPYGLSDTLALYAPDGEDVPPAIGGDCLDLAAASEADLLLNFRYSLPQEVRDRFKRSALVDIDPGLLESFAGQRVQIDGWFDELDRATNPAGRDRADDDLVEIRGSAIRAIAKDCAD